MNSVSWFIYIAQVSGSLGKLFCFVGGAIFLALMLSFGIPRLYNHIECNRPGDGDYWTPPAFRSTFAALAFLFLVVGNLMPDRNTMYAIAASQVGEQIVSNETVKGVANDATKALQIWIKKQIEPDNKS